MEIRRYVLTVTSDRLAKTNSRKFIYLLAKDESQIRKIAKTSQPMQYVENLTVIFQLTPLIKKVKTSIISVSIIIRLVIKGGLNAPYFVFNYFKSIHDTFHLISIWKC